MAVGAQHVLDLDAFARFLASAVAGPPGGSLLPQLQARDDELGPEGSWSLLTTRVAALRPDLNGYIESLGLEHHRRVKAVVQSFLAADGSRFPDGAERGELLRAADEELRRRGDRERLVLVPAGEAEMHMPLRIGDFTDFYASREHAFNVGTMFRGKDRALQPNWAHMPIGYHGRASSVVVSGTGIRRPRGQVLDGARAPPGPSGEDAPGPSYGDTKVLDFELEVGCVIGKGNALGTPVGVGEAEGHLFGLVLLNDWSARDIQKWEYVPLGPFNGKNFATTISPWVVTWDALGPFACEAPTQDPAVLPYLDEGAERRAIDAKVSAHLRPAGCADSFPIAEANLKSLYWTFAQMVAHHTAGGCNLRVGDLLGSGTISSVYGRPPAEGEGRDAGEPPPAAGYGSLLERTWLGKEAVVLPNGARRTFLEDGDTVTLRGSCGDGASDYRISFGECSGTILRAPPGEP